MNTTDKVRKRFVLFAALSVFVLLCVLLSIINGVNFTMAAADADEITRALADRKGVFGPAVPDTAPPGNPDNATPGDIGNASENINSAPRNSTDAAPLNTVPDNPDATPPGDTPGNPDNATPGDTGRTPPRNRQPHRRGPRIGPMGPDSPETTASTRYFTYAFDENGNSERIAFQLSAVSEEDAETWADSLRRTQQTGWTRTTYRYRVYHSGGWDFVTVIDQGRELLPSFRILIISVIGGLLGVAVSYLFLLSVSERLFKPLEEADRKQKRFIADVEKDFKVPLTVMDADAEILEKEHGETEQTLSIHRQIRRMASLVRDLSALAIFDDEDFEAAELDLSGFARAAADTWRGKFAEKGMSLATEVGDGIAVQGDGASLAALFEELLDNALKFGKSAATLSVKQDNNRVEIVLSNDTDLPPKSVEQVFDRFTRLDNAEGIPGAGLGLSHAKEIVRAHNGRISAKVADGTFSVRVSL